MKLFKSIMQSPSKRREKNTYINLLIADADFHANVGLNYLKGINGYGLSERKRLANAAQRLERGQKKIKEAVRAIASLEKYAPENDDLTMSLIKQQDIPEDPILKSFKSILKSIDHAPDEVKEELLKELNTNKPEEDLSIAELKLRILNAQTTLQQKQTKEKMNVF